MAEKRIGVLTQMSCGGLFNIKQYNIFITDERLIFSFMSKEAKKETQKRLDEKVKGKSFKERLSIIASHGYVLPEQYHEMAIDDIANEHPNNIVILLEDVVKLSIKRPKAPDSKGFAKSDYFVLKTKDKKIKITPASKEDMKLFNTVLGDRAKIPRIIL